MFADARRAAHRSKSSKRGHGQHHGIRYGVSRLHLDHAESAATVGNILVDNGYNTAWFGKHHLVPEWMQGPGGPFDQWAGGLGFEYFYGFLGGDTDQFHPALFENTTPVLPPFGDPNYILIHDLADRSINWIRTQHAAAPDKPFFLYFAPGNSHAPHQASTQQTLPAV